MTAPRQAEANGSAVEAGLRYVLDTSPGLRRVAERQGWRYVDSSGKRLSDEAAIRRIRSLAIPPAWTDVWICSDARGHLQATGRDTKGRKQYRYHPRWREVRDEAKFERLAAFARALPGIRKRTEQDLGRPGIPREKVLAAVVRLLETTLIRVGNEEYARQNGSFGLTTLRNRHVNVSPTKVEFSFNGKSGKRRRLLLHDARLARVVRRCRDIPGQQLFQYLDDDGERQAIGSADVNGYLREISGDDFTAKDFRTWAGTVAAARALHEIGPAASVTEAKHNIVEAVKATAETLGNTPAIARKSYIHPAVLLAYEDGTPLPVTSGGRGSRFALDAYEKAVLKLLELPAARINARCSPGPASARQSPRRRPDRASPTA